MRTAWILIGTLAAGCFTEPGIAPPDMGAPSEDLSDEAPLADLGGDDAATVGLTVSTESPVRIVPGSSVDVTVTIARDGTEGAVSLTATDVPSGVTISSDGVGAGSTEGVLTVTATDGATSGGPFRVSVDASAGDVLASAPLDVIVAGDSGSLDDSFGADGVVALPAGSGDDTVSAIVVDERGRVLVAGRSSADPTGYVLAVQANGQLDDSFANAGLFTDLGGTSSEILGGAYAEGVVLNARVDGSAQLVRVTLDGVLDDEWGAAPLAAGASGPVWANDELVLWAGPTVYKFADAGSPSVFDAPAEIAALAADDAGRILVGQAGTTVVSRLQSEGGLDTEFGANGSLQLGGNYAVNSLSVTTNGAFATAAGASDSILARFDRTGTLVATFGAAGILNLGTDEPQQVLAAGTSVLVVVDRAGAVVVIRYQSNGMRDLTFGSGGEVVLDAVGLPQMAIDVVGGRLVVAYPTGVGIEVQRWWL